MLAAVTKGVGRAAQTEGQQQSLVRHPPEREIYPHRAQPAQLRLQVIVAAAHLARQGLVLRRNTLDGVDDARIDEPQCIVG